MATRYAVDLMRGAYYADRPEAPRVVLADPATNLAMLAAALLAFMVIGTALCVRAERNR